MSDPFAAARAPRFHAGFRRRDGDRRVGVLYPHYGLEKVSYALPLERFTFVTVKAVPFYRLLDRGGTFWAHTPLLVDRSVPLVHTFNALPLNARRFVVSFEMELPRYLGHCPAAFRRVGWRILRSGRCRGVLALSNAAKRFFEARMLREGCGGLADKLTVFRGGLYAADASAPDTGRWDARGPLRVIFVGADARRKGLAPLLSAIRRLRNGGLDILLTVVSSIERHTYVFPDDVFPAEDLRGQVAARPWVTYHARLGNAGVRRLMRSSHLFVLPTFDESLGWSLVEAGLEGLPLVSTNVFAVPELLLDGRTGRMIQIDLNEDLRWAGIYLDDAGRREHAMHTAGTVEKHLVAILEHACLNRDSLRAWGLASQEHLMNLYSPNVAAPVLQGIYESALR